LQRAVTDGAELEYEALGTGEPVVFIHGAFITDTFRPLLAEGSLADRYRLILYHRRGYVGSSRGDGADSIARQAADCRALLRHLGVERAHIAGHSYGGCVALQLALDAPDVVGSLALLEPGLMVGASAAGYREALARGAERYREAGASVAVEEFLQARWPGYGTALERALPGAVAQAVADAETWFERELPGQLEWSFGEAEARRITQPALSSSAARATLSGPDSARRTGCSWRGCRAPKASSCPARRTSCSSRTRAAWPRHWLASSPATRSRAESSSRSSTSLA
jgi:pimeloyl-ACP methyl ester carboxylesterase